MPPSRKELTGMNVAAPRELLGSKLNGQRGSVATAPKNGMPGFPCPQIGVIKKVKVVPGASPVKLVEVPKTDLDDPPSVTL